MVYFGSYLKDYLEYNNISQSEFAKRLGVTQKHMNEIIQGKTNITMEMACTIARLTDITPEFIMSVEQTYLLEKELESKYGDRKEVERMLKSEYSLNDLKKANWIKFKDETDSYRVSIDIMEFLKVKNFDIHTSLKENVLFKKTGEDYNKLALWIARCDELTKNQEVEEYDSSRFNELISELKEYSYNTGFELESIREILNKYGIRFICEKALPGTKVRGCFKVKGRIPCIYITMNYKAKDSLFFEIYHELGHCKSDYNMAKSKTIIDGDEAREERADFFAINTMINESVVKELLESTSEEELLNISKINRIPMSFIVGKLANCKKIKYDSELYNKYKMI